MIVIVTVRDDVHALAIQREILGRGEECLVVETDGLSGYESVSLHIENGGTRGALRTSSGRKVEVSAIKLIWLRRFVAAQKIEVPFEDPSAKSVVDNDCFDALTSLLNIEFRGKWISTPTSTLRASNKIFQLSAAAASGFRVPETLVTQSKVEVTDFYERLDGKVIVKCVFGTPDRLLLTRRLSDPLCITPESYMSCPAIYQEFIEGSRNIRLNCFGDRSYAAAIDSPHVDWRPDLDVPVNTWSVPNSVHDKVRLVLDRLNLEMGVIDLRETREGELVWLEVNPQGQFLFLEPLSGTPMREHLSDYLVREARKV